MIYTIHNAGLRISIGDFKSNPCSSIYNIARIPSLKLAKEAIVSSNVFQCQVYSITDIKQIIKNTILNIWQNEWKTSNTKLNE